MSKCYQFARKAARDLYKTWTLHYLYPSRYRRFAKRPAQEKKAVFLQVKSPQLADNFMPIMEKMEEEGGWIIKIHCLGEGVSSHKAVRENCLKALEDIADAKYIFVNDSSYFTGCLPLRTETKLIQLWHACGAFKKFGYSSAENSFGGGIADLERFPLHHGYSAVTVSSPEVVWAYAQAFHMEQEREKILPVGIPRTDCFFRQESYRRAYEKLYQILPDCFGKKIILYAPTFRGKVARAAAPDVLDFEQLHGALGEDYIILCKYHPLVKRRPIMPDTCAGYVTDVTEQMDIASLLMVSDICISDYSSLIFEYSLMERPMIFLAYDLEEYYDDRGFYYPYEEMTPGPIVKTTEEVIQRLQHLEEWFDADQVCRFRDKFMSACDGHATERLLEALKT